MNTFIENGMIELNFNELLNVNGGTYASGYEAGHSVGQTVRKYIDTALLEWQFLKLFL